MSELTDLPLYREQMEALVMSEFEKKVDAYRHKVVCQLSVSRFGTLAESKQVQDAWHEECAAKQALLDEHARVVEELSLQKQMLAALKHTVVATIGGHDNEGNPTSEINYLQRLRRLVEIEKERDELKASIRATIHAVPIVEFRHEYWTAKAGKRLHTRKLQMGALPTGGIKVKLCANPACLKPIPESRTKRTKYCDMTCARRAWYVEQKLKGKR